MGTQWEIDFDYDNFEDVLYEAGLQAFTEIQDQYDGETFYTFGFEASSIFEAPGIMACTEERLYSHAMDKYSEFNEEADFTLDEAIAYLRYNYLEYHYFGPTVDDKLVMDPVRELIFHEWEKQLHDLDDVNSSDGKYYSYPDVYEYHYNRLEAKFLKVISRLDGQSVFERTNERSNIALFLRRLDYFPEFLHDTTMHMINPPDVVERFYRERERAVALSERMPY